MKRIFLLAVGLVLAACSGLQTSSEWVVRGDGYLKDGKLSKALSAYNRAYALNPDNVDVYASRGTAYYFAGGYAQAQDDFLKVLELNPYKLDAYTALASALAAQGEYEAALQVIDRVVPAGMNKPEVFFTRGGIHFMLGQYEQAVYDYSHVLQLRRAADVYRARAAAYAKLGRPEEARQDLAAADTPDIPAKLSQYAQLD